MPTSAPACARSERAFTLIELLIAMVLLAIVFGVAFLALTRGFAGSGFAELAAHLLGRG